MDHMYRILKIKSRVAIIKSSSYRLIGIFRSRILELNGEIKPNSSKNAFSFIFRPTKAAICWLRNHLPESTNFQKLSIFKLWYVRARHIYTNRSASLTPKTVSMHPLIAGRAVKRVSERRNDCINVRMRHLPTRGQSDPWRFFLTCRA